MATSCGGRGDEDATGATTSRRFRPIPVVSMKKATMCGSWSWFGDEGRPVATGSTASVAAVVRSCIDFEKGELEKGNGLGFDQAAGEGLMRLGASTDERHEEIGRVDGARACLAPWPRSPLSRATGKAG